jgi:hypothetical protein
MQTWTDNCFQSDHQAQTNLQAFEDNFQCLKTAFSGDAAPSSPSQGQWWFDTNSNILKIRNEANTAWISVFNFATNVLMLSRADGVLSADAAGRAKMADLFVTNAKINDVNGSKITDNTVSAAKIQNNAVTPSKMAVGAANLWEWTHYPGGIGSDQSVVVSSGNGAAWALVARAYRYIPPGVRYVVLALRGASQNQQANFRLYIEGYTGSNCAPPYNSGVVSTNGAAFDISALNSAFRVIELQCQDNGGIASLQSFAVQFWGA